MRCKVADWGNLGFTAHTLIAVGHSVDRGRGRGSQRSSLSRHFLRFSRMTRHYSKTLGHLSVRTPSRFVQFWANGSLARLTTLHASFNIWLSVRPSPRCPRWPAALLPPLGRACRGARRPSAGPLFRRVEGQEGFIHSWESRHFGGKKAADFSPLDGEEGRGEN